MATNKDFVVKNGLQVGANTSIEGSITTVDSIQFDLTANTDPYAEGQLAWNADHGTLTLGIDGNDIDLHIGEDTIIKVKAAATITKGDVVYASGAVGNSGNIEVTPFIANATIDAKRVIGIAGQDIATGNFGYVVSEGEIRGIDASGGLTTGGQTWNDGDILYASPDYAGELTNVEPTAPNQDIAIAFVVSNNGSNGILQVRATQLGYTLDELHNINISSVANNQVLTYDAVNSRWSNSDDLNLPGDLTVAGNFTVSGNTTLVNTNNLAIEDLNIVVASGVANSSLAEGAGITIAPDSANVVLGYNATDDALDLNNTLMFSDGRDGYLTNTLPGIYRAFSTTGTYPFNRYGDLVIQARSSHARDIVFATGLTPANRMVINSDGDVGIGTNTPARRLEVYNGSSSMISQFRSGSGNDSFICFANQSSNADQVRIGSSGSSLVLSTNYTPRLTITNGGDATFSANVSAANMSATTITATDFVGDLNGSVANTTLNYSTTTLADNAGSQGKFYFDALNQKLKVHTGSVWVDAVPAGSGSSGNTTSTDANTTFRKYSYDITTSTNSVSGADNANNTLTYVTTGEQNVEAFVNGVKQVEGASYDYVATTGTSVTFTSNLSSGDNVEIQVYELLTNDAYYLKTETYTQTETNQQISTALQGYVPATGGTFSGAVGLGVTNPTYGKLSIAPGAGNQAIFIWDTSESAQYLGITGGNNAQISASGLGTTSNDLTFVTRNAGSNVDVMFLSSTGKVGIGNTAPTAILQVTGGSGLSSIGIQNPSFMVGEYAGQNLSFDENEIQSRSNGVAQPLLMQKNGGNVGIGDNTSPAGKLHVYDSGPQVIVQSDTTAYAGLQLKATTQADGGTAGYVYGYSGTQFLGGMKFNRLDSNSGEILFRQQINNTNTDVASFQDGNFIPLTSTSDLGSTSNPWQNIYTQDLVLSNEARPTGNEVDGTKGNWTIQEGEDHLYIINNKNGKKYRFALEEIE